MTWFLLCDLFSDVSIAQYLPETENLKILKYFFKTSVLLVLCYLFSYQHIAIKHVFPSFFRRPSNSSLLKLQPLVLF